MGAEQTERGGDFDQLRSLVNESFPNFHCLRCGFGDVYLGPGAAGPWGAPALTLVCARCGHVEQHLIEVLRPASKPIPDTARTVVIDHTNRDTVDQKYLDKDNG
jgi:hypothetical protein